MRYYLTGLLIFLTTSCTQGKNEHFSNSETKQEELSDRDIALVEQKKHTAFSDNKEKDEFLIYVIGETIYEGTAIFQITNQKGVVIHKENFPAHFLIGYGFTGDRNSVREMEEYIVERLNDFFDEQNFIYPAIRSEENFDEDYSNKEIWEDIQSDPTAIGFYYLIGEEDGRRIAYSKKNGKVVMYHNCC
jgi:hypothetical protein